MTLAHSLVLQSGADIGRALGLAWDRNLRRLSARMSLRRYLATLSTGRLILWCYFIWYAVVLVRYFDSRPRLWLTSLGLSAIIGFALYLSTAGSGTTKVKFDRWQLFRLFLMPFCVSSFAALVKDKGFILVFSPSPAENLLAVALCAVLCLAVFALKKRWSKTTQPAVR